MADAYADGGSDHSEKGQGEPASRHTSEFVDRNCAMEQERSQKQDLKSRNDARACSSSTPFIHLLGECGNRFVLDVHTSRLFSVTSRESDVLSRWLSGTPLMSMAPEYPEEVRSILRLRAQGLFCCDRPQALAFGTDWKGLCEKIEHERYLTILELTQQCNLRCRYCVFGGGFQERRSHRPVTMSADLLRAAVASAAMKEVLGKREPMTVVLTRTKACDCGCACPTTTSMAGTRKGAKAGGQAGGSGCKCSKKSLFASARD